jgi:Carboxypeptidase regulatory-like domain
MTFIRTLRLQLAAVSVLTFATGAFAQSNTADLRGTVTDQTGAVVAEAWVTLESVGGKRFYETSSRTGTYRFERVPPGHYTLIVSQPGFMPFRSLIELKAGAAAIDVRLRVAIAVAVDVRETQDLSVEPRKNLSGLILTRKDLDSLPDDPRLLLLRIMEIAGTSGRPGDVAVYVNGFREYRRLPQKGTIELVRVNSNVFSAEFSQPGAQRIEIVTKPGADSLHGDIAVQSRATPLEARDPITNYKPDTRYYNYKGYLQGPIVKGRIGFLGSAGYWQQDDNAFLHATVLAPSTLAVTPFSARIATPIGVMSQSMQIDFKQGGDLVNASYARTRETDRNLGLQSGFDLAEHAYDRAANDGVARVWWTRVAGHLVNDARVEFSRAFAATTPLTTTSAILVLDAFNAGGNQNAWTERSTRSMQASDAVTLQRGRHTYKAGVQYEAIRQDIIDYSGFGGTFTFGTDVDRDGAGRTRLDAAGQPIVISPLERYRRTVLGLPGYVPSQFVIVRGDPEVGVEQRNVGWFFLDDWSPSRRMSLSYGVRHEMQNDVAVRLNLAPRATASWLLDDAGKSAVKVGGGLFYRRVESDIAFDVKRLDGINRRQYTIESPSFFTTPVNALDEGLPAQSTIYTRSADLRNPLALVSTVSFERQLPGDMFAVAQYLINKGVDQLRLRNITAVMPGTGGPPPDPILQFESTGHSLQQQLMLGLRQSMEGLSAYVNYTWGTKRSDTDGLYSLPADSHDLGSEYGWASDDQRHVLVAGATIEAGDDLIISPAVTIGSGRPFNITTGRDNNNDTRFTDRPAFAQPGDPAAIVTAFGTFDPNPRPGAAIIPRNLGREPMQVNVDVSATKTLARGITVTLDMQNIFNNSRLYGSTGVLTSELFGRPNLALNGRRLWVTGRYGF